MAPSEMTPQEFDARVASELGDPKDDAAPDIAAPAWLSALPAAPPPQRSVGTKPEVEKQVSTKPARRRTGTAVGVSAAVLVVGAVAVVGLLVNSAESPTVDVVTPTSKEPVVDTTWCAGLGAGAPAAVDSQDPGTAAIAGFEWAYYVLRDGVRVREFVSTDARVGSAEQISQGIQQIPVGTTHCVLVRKAVEGAYAVDVFERRPDGTTEHYPQTVLTAATADGTRITAITSREE